MAVAPTEEELLLALLKRLLGLSGQSAAPPITVNVTIDTDKMATRIVDAIEGKHGSRTIQSAPA
jgi:hypothetical protein